MAVVAAHIDLLYLPGKHINCIVHYDTPTVLAAKSLRTVYGLRHPRSLSTSHGRRRTQVETTDHIARMPKLFARAPLALPGLAH